MFCRPSGDPILHHVSSRTFPRRSLHLVLICSSCLSDLVVFFGGGADVAFHFVHHPCKVTGVFQARQVSMQWTCSCCKQQEQLPAGQRGGFRADQTHFLPIVLLLPHLASILSPLCFKMMCCESRLCMKDKSLCYSLWLLVVLFLHLLALVLWFLVISSG